MSTELNQFYLEIGWNLEPKEADGSIKGISESPQRTIDELIDRGKVWYEERVEKLKEKVCNSGITNRLTNPGDIDELTLALADLVAGLCWGVPPFTIARHIAKMGVKNFCKNCVQEVEKVD